MNADRYLNWADCLLLVYAVDDRASFTSVDPFIREWEAHGRMTHNGSSKRRQRSASHDATASNGQEQQQQPQKKRSVTPILNGYTPAMILVGNKSELEMAR